MTDNYRGYEEADVSKKAGNLRDKRFLLIHGTADLRAHYVQSMLLVRALAREGALFQHQVGSALLRAHCTARCPLYAARGLPIRSSAGA